MIKIEHIETYGWEAAIRGMRNPMNSWDKSDSHYDYYCGCPTQGHGDFYVGLEDLKLMQKLSTAGSDHRKFMRMITITMDITAPLYWWKEFDTYKVGTVANSCSTVHKITDKELTIDDFSDDCLTFNKNIGVTDDDNSDNITTITPAYLIDITIRQLNRLIDVYKNWNPISDNEIYGVSRTRLWKAIIQLLPSSYNQKRTVQMNYEVFSKMCDARSNHKLDEWREFCKVVYNELPYKDII